MKFHDVKGDLVSLAATWVADELEAQAILDEELDRLAANRVEVDAAKRRLSLGEGQPS